MTNTVETPDLTELISLFYPSAAALGEFERVTPGSLPPPYRKLLAHYEHMTVTVEEFHGCRVDVRVLEAKRGSQEYCRKILLTRQSDGQVVQFGIVRLNLGYLEEPVRREIVSQGTPLGRVLIEHNVLREVELVGAWRIAPGPDLVKLFGLTEPTTCYGRTAIIHCNGEPAVELLEIVTP
jgi:chorismate-pyruvate lyase